MKQMDAAVQYSLKEVVIADLSNFMF